MLKVCHTLAALNFEELFDTFLEKLKNDPETFEFGQYLEKSYGSRKVAWAYA